MLSFSTWLFLSAIQFSVVKSLDNFEGSESSYITRKPSSLGQIRSSRSAAVDPHQSYTDDDVKNDPMIFNNVAQYELLQALHSEGIDSSENVVESHSKTKYKRWVKIPPTCNATTLYLYYKCTDPNKTEIEFKKYRGLGYCPPRMTQSTHIQTYNTNHQTYSTHSPAYSTYRRAYSTHFGTHYIHRQRYYAHRRSHSALPYPDRYTIRRENTLIGYRYIKKHIGGVCAATSGTFLDQVAPEFGLKGKKKIYLKVIILTFLRIRRRYRGFQYVIQFQLYEKNGNIYVRFLFDKKHTREAEH